MLKYPQVMFEGKHIKETLVHSLRFLKGTFLGETPCKSEWSD